MTQTPLSSKGQPRILITQDGPGFSYTITWNGVSILSGWCRGKRAEAVRDAASRLKVWREGNLATARPETRSEADELEQEAARFEPTSLSKHDDPAYWLQTSGACHG